MIYSAPAVRVAAIIFCNMANSCGSGILAVFSAITSMGSNRCTDPGSVSCGMERFTAKFSSSGRNVRFANAFVPYVLEIKPILIPPTSRITGAACSSLDRDVPVCPIPTRSNTSSVRYSPTVPRSRQWLFAVETKPNPASRRMSANSSGVLKEYICCENPASSPAKQVSRLPTQRSDALKQDFIR